MVNNNSITAYLRVKNEENTIIPCLESIKGIFDKILIIYSEINDSSLSLMIEYISQNQIKNIDIQKYPHKVLPPYSEEYKDKNYAPEQSLASYYNFGLQFIDTNLVCKIDADQIYFTKILKKKIDQIKYLDHSNYCYGIVGHHCLIDNNKIFQEKGLPFNGGADSWITSMEDIYFKQEIYWEQKYSKKNKKCIVYKDPMWIHMRITDKKQNISLDDIFLTKKTRTLKPLSKKVIADYEKYVKPLLIKTNSRYQNLNYKND